jgi:glycosyltransferase involved in cell wall biosynthesis
MSKVSVLVAAYNAAQYVDKCLASLCGQTFTDLQILCVDDASTDDTPKRLDRWAAKDPRIHVIHLTENGGQAHARNVALQQVDGDYVCMLDSDDWLSADALERAVEVLDTHPLTDCVLFQVVEVTGDSQRLYPLPDFERMSGAEAFEASLTWRIHGLYMVRAQLHKRYPFDDSSRSYSDDNTTRIHYLNSREVRVCQGIYYYLQHGASVTHRVSVRRFDYLKANESMLRQMRDSGVDDRLLTVYENVRWLNVIDLYMFYFKHRRELTPEERRYGLDEIHRVWSGIDLRRLTLRNRLKPGYAPLRPLWCLFRIVEEIYFTLRFLLKGK